MKDKKLQVFVSSTYSDLKEERQAAVEAILSSGHIPAGMELFAAGDESQMAVIERWIDESDVYLLILGGRYGSIDKNTGKSYTHLEYEYALKKGKPLFAVVINESTLEKRVKEFGSSVIETENSKQLKEFRAAVLNNLVRFWEDKKDIKIAIHETISEFIYRKELVGWIRGDNSVNTGFLAEEIARLTKENSELREKVIANNSANVLYSNLTYDQISELLRRDTATFDGKEYDLFDFLLLVADAVSREEIVIDAVEKGLEKLAVLRLIRRTQHFDMETRYAFTDEGHSFYLRALLMTGGQ